jgi:hypothetical protein
MSDFAENFRYELPNDDMYPGNDERLIEANRIKLNHVTDRPGWNLTFEYDYGDGLEVDLALEDCEKREVSLADLTWVLNGAGYGIIEDVGGVGGLAELGKALNFVASKEEAVQRLGGAR